MRARNLKPGFFKNEILGSADPLYGQLFQGLWCMADREGRLEDRPLRISAELFPYRRNVTEKRVDAMLWWLHEQKFITRYRTNLGLFIQVLEFHKHQSPHKHETASAIQAPTPDSHRTRPGAAPCADESKQVVARLTPSSLTPDSGLLTPDSPFTDSSTPGQGQANGHVPEKRSEALRMQMLQRLKDAYPRGLYPEADWIVAERDAWQRHDEGHAWEEFVAGATRYAAQCQALGTPRRYVRSPKDFFTVREHRWQEAYPLPEPSETEQPPRAKSADELEAEAIARGEKLWQ